MAIGSITCGYQKDFQNKYYNNIILYKYIKYKLLRCKNKVWEKKMEEKCEKKEFLQFNNNYMTF